MKKLLTLSEAGALTNRNLKGMRQLVYRGNFPCTKIGGRVYVDEDELTRFLALSRKTTAEQAAGATEKEE
jgi:hypothetical protein